MPLAMDQCAQNGIENMIESFPQIFRQKSEDEIAFLLEQCVLAAIAPVSSIGTGDSSLAMFLDGERKTLRLRFGHAQFLRHPA